MKDKFLYDVFLSYSSKDKTTVLSIAQRLNLDGINVWFDEWKIKPGDNIPSKIEDGLEHSRVLLFFMSENAFVSDWTSLESNTYRFRDPLNKERRFIPVRLDNTPAKGSLGQFSYISWLIEDHEQAYIKLLEACRPPMKIIPDEQDSLYKHEEEYVIKLTYPYAIYAYAFLLNGERVFTSSRGLMDSLLIWDLRDGRLLEAMERKGNRYDRTTDLAKYMSISSEKWRKVIMSFDQKFVVTTDGKIIHIWDIYSGHNSEIQTDLQTVTVGSLAMSDDNVYVISVRDDTNICVWDRITLTNYFTFKGHSSIVRCVGWRNSYNQIISGSDDKTLRLWDMHQKRCLHVFEGHTDTVMCIAIDLSGKKVLSGSKDGTIRLWDLMDKSCISILTGHTDRVTSIAWIVDDYFAISGSSDKTVRLWNVVTGKCLSVFQGHKAEVVSLFWDTKKNRVFSADFFGCIYVWNLSKTIQELQIKYGLDADSASHPEQIQYTNAKVLLVGESGVGKTGLSKRLIFNSWEPTDSTVGAWATQWKLPSSASGMVEKEVWLWDFGGQADQRLIHQLFMDETALAVLVFDGQKDDLYETLCQWDRDLTRASQKEFTKILVAGRVDTGGIRVSYSEIKKFIEERKFSGFIETSAKSGLGCSELKQAILDGINWEDIPSRTTEVLFKRLKEEIIRLKDSGNVLMRFNELREVLQIKLSGEFKQFTDDELKAVLTLLAGPGIIWELKFGSWVLLQPERINAYAQAVIQTIRSDESQRGCLLEELVLTGRLKYESSMRRINGDEERFVLLAMHQTLIEKGLCIRQPSEKGNLLIFPSFYRRERPEQVKFPAVLLSYRFKGFLDDIYATLIVRLHHTGPFSQDQLWRSAADFRTNFGKKLGVKLIRHATGEGELDVYFDSMISIEEKIIFSKYINEHLLQHAFDVERLRYFICPSCGTPVGNREVAMRRLANWLQNSKLKTSEISGGISDEYTLQPTIICSECEKRIPLWDDLEQCFADPKIQKRVHEMQQESNITLDNESKERALVGEVISTVTLAGQICRELNVADYGIDMEIEFKNNNNEATGNKIYLQLKYRNTFNRVGKADGGELLHIETQDHITHWVRQEYPVFLLLRNPNGDLSWMEVRRSLKKISNNGKKYVKNIVFKGERFDVMSVRNIRDFILSGKYNLK